MKYCAAFLLAFSLLSCTTVSKIQDPKKPDASFCYGSFNYGHKKSRIESVSIRPVGQIIGMNIGPRLAGDNEFFIDSLSPGKYYVEYILIDGMRINFKMLSKESPWVFEVFPNSVINIGSYEIIETKSGGFMGEASISRSSRDVEEQVLEDLLFKSKGTYWEKRLKKFLDENY